MPRAVTIAGSSNCSQPIFANVKRVQLAQPKIPLSPQQLQDFIRNGFLVLWPTFQDGATYHERAYNEAARIVAQGEVGNNLLSEEVSPEGTFEPIIDSPEIAGALTSILGDDYALLLSRHCHTSKSGSVGQALHQDDFFGFDRFRQMVPTEVMIFYYPQAVTNLMGPTAVLPGSQYSMRSKCAKDGSWLPGEPQNPEQLLTFDKPGACMLMHWNLWHRGTQQLGGSHVPVRYALKFQFRRARPFSPPPTILHELSAGHNPFLPQAGKENEPPAACNSSVPIQSSRVVKDQWIHAAVWAAICGKALSFDTSCTEGDAACPFHNAPLAVASGVWHASDAAAKLLPLLYAESTHTAPIIRNPWLTDGFPDTRCEAAAALQFCNLPATCFEHVSHEASQSSWRRTAAHVVISAIAGSNSYAPVERWHADWRLEAIYALAALLSPSEILNRLVPLIVPPADGRVQLQALMGIYNSGVKCNAPESQAWHEAADAAKLEAQLLHCVAWWQSWRSRKQQQLNQTGTTQGVEPSALQGPAIDGAGRYALSEALRCVSRFASPSTARQAACIIGVPERAQLYCGAGWRQRFGHFIERRRRCPITTVHSTF